MSWSFWPASTEPAAASAIANVLAVSGETVMARAPEVVAAPSEAVTVCATAFVSVIRPPAEETPLENVIVVGLPKDTAAPVFVVTVGAVALGEARPPENVSAWSPV